MTIKIFVSHAAADEKLASALVDCIFSCMVLDDEEVRCTSVPGHKLPIGGDSASILRDELSKTGVVVGLLTQNSISSSWVLFELGATWGARKNLQPLLADDVDYAELPGPLSGCHAGKLAEKNDLVQFFEELRKVIGAKARSAAKIDAAINQLIKENLEFSKISLTPKPPKKINAKSNIPDPTISGMKFSELTKILEKDKIVIPPPHSGSEEEVESNLLTLFIANHTSFGDGLQSNWDSESAGGFLYREVGLKLIPYELVKFDKLPAAQAKWFKRLIISPNGQKFIAHFNRLRVSE
ncbi:toll/interleukin-1 receptor domain-containing protein [Reinekea sp. G2M2-21]|uniref:toll/interleukin-1 receptor domain-containing protein n=1 Tax=Reinekea sp. G2M2-21 TaxID=2788942 RepID=UPI0018A98947|nr:toll/interleukin-1 receptor domain-containing protein [Reinekea sp. G2M2-21]